jgi:hypothetical protein
VGLVADHDDLGIGRTGLDHTAGTGRTFPHDKEVGDGRSGSPA